MSVPSAALERELRVLIAKCDVSTTSIKSIRHQLEESLGVDLKAQKDEVKALIHAIMEEQQPQEEEEEEEDDDDEDNSAAASSSSTSKRRASADSETSWHLSGEMMEFLGTEEAEMPYAQAQTLVQQYLKTMPKDPKDGRKYQCDEKLVALFGVKKIGLFGIGKHLKKHIKRWTTVEAAADSASDDDEGGDSDDQEEGTRGKSTAKKRAAPSSSSTSSAAKKKKPATKKKKAGKNEDAEKKPRAPGGFASVLYLLSPPLQTVVGAAELSRPQVVKMIWQYVKKHELQNPDKKTEIRCDPNLKAIFSGEDTVTAFSMNKHISQHLTKK